MCFDTVRQHLHFISGVWVYLFAISPHCCTIKAEIKHHCCTELLLFLEKISSKEAVREDQIFGDSLLTKWHWIIYGGLFWFTVAKKKKNTLGKWILKQLTSVDKMLPFHSMELHSVALVFSCSRFKHTNLGVVRKSYMCGVQVIQFVLSKGIKTWSDSEARGTIKGSLWIWICTVITMCSTG